jgi:hypothetical protein
MLQYRLCLGRRLADVNVAPQDNGAWLPAVSGAALTVDIGLRTHLLGSEAGAGDPALREPCRAVDGRRCAGADPDFDGLSRTQRKARFGDTEAREELTVSPASRRRTMSSASSKAEGRVLMLAPMAANRASPQPSPHCMIKRPWAMAASVPICSATSTGCHKGSKNRHPAGALPHSARSRPSIGVFW